MRADIITSGIWVKRCCKPSDHYSTCQLPSVLSCLLLLQHDFTGPSQFSQFDLGILGSVQRHLTVLPGWVSGTFMRLTSSYLGKRQENYCFILLFTIWHTLTDYILFVVLVNAYCLWESHYEITFVPIVLSNFCQFRENKNNLKL